MAAAESNHRSRPSTKAEQAVVARTALIESAIDLYGEHGYSQTTLSMVCQHAGYSRGIIGHYFGSKTEFTKSVMTEIRKGAAKRSSAAAGEERGTRALGRYLDYYVLGLAKHESRRRTINTLAEAAGTSETALREIVADHNRAFVSAFTDQLEAAKELGEIDTATNSHAIAYNLVAMLRGLVQLWAIDPQGLELVDLAKAARALVDGLITQPA